MPSRARKLATASGGKLDQAFLKGLAVLEAMARLEGSAGVTELANMLGLGKSNVHRLLQTLIHAGYVRQLEDSRYVLTVKLWELGAQVHKRLDLRTEALPFMEQLAAQTQETVHLSVRDGVEVLYIEKIDSPLPVRAYTAVGGRAPAANVATGKVMLAWADAATVKQAASSLHAFTPLSMTSAHELDQALQAIRRHGYAINRGEWREEVVGLAAPIRDVHGSVVGALGISGPASRLPQTGLREHAAAVMQRADSISSRLGWPGHH